MSEPGAKLTQTAELFTCSFVLVQPIDLCPHPTLTIQNTLHISNPQSYRYITNPPPNTKLSSAIAPAKRAVLSILGTPNPLAIPAGEPSVPA